MISAKIKQLAINKATLNHGIRNQFKLAALMVHKGKVVAIGNNSYKTHPLQAKFQRKYGSVCLHAEIDCLKNAAREIGLDRLSKCKIVVARVKKVDGVYASALAKPCKGCERALVQFDVGECWFSTDSGFERLW